MAKKSKHKKEKAEDRCALITRVIKAKESLPGSGLSTLFLKKFPEFDTYKKRSRLNNVLQFRVTDEDITLKLEALAAAMTTALK